MFFTARKAVDVCRDMVTNVQVSKNDTNVQASFNAGSAQIFHQ